MKKDYCFCEEVVIDVGDGLKENVFNYSNEDLSKEDKIKIFVVNVWIVNMILIVLCVVIFWKFYSNKNIIVFLLEKLSRKVNGSDEVDDLVLDERRNWFCWKRLEIDSGYFIEIYLGSGFKIIIIVENFLKLYNEE